MAKRAAKQLAIVVIVIGFVAACHQLADDKQANNFCNCWLSGCCLLLFAVITLVLVQQTEQQPVVLLLLLLIIKYCASLIDRMQAATVAYSSSFLS